ncbi:ATP-grasp domain-containing protein [Micromonospora sp. WMMD723]|uniref:ATP-grasp domain-containing protein n=1 Tax=unclassified Micromonospora TaxID=2617518 RepID=UPI003B9488B6
MSVLILHRNPLEPFPYRDWLADHDQPAVLLAARDKIESFGEQIPTDTLGLAHLEVLDHYDRDVAARATALAAHHRPRHVVALHEADLELAAELRARFGLPGPRPADIRPFRDKLLMKQRAVAAGIEVAPHTLATTAGQVRAFAADHGYPVVLKQRAGYNSVGLRIVRSAGELPAHLDELYRDGDRDDLLVERFVPGRMCHVDGFVRAGRTVLAWPSQYQYDLASFGSDPGPRIDVTLDPDDPLTGRLLDLVDRVLAALTRSPGALTDHAFHAEVFHTPDDRLVLCEIACRSGGAKIREVFEVMFGVNLAEAELRTQLGLPVPALDRLTGDARPRPRSMSGQMLMMKRPGLVRTVPSPPTEPWVRRFWCWARPGQVIPPAAGSADFLTAAVAAAPTRVECEARLRRLGDRVAAQIQIGEAS